MENEEQVSTSNSKDEESNSYTDSLLSRGMDYKVYSERWYILIVFSVLNVMQSAVYNTFGPISNSLVVAFNLNQTDIALLPNWNNIVYFLGIVPFVYLINTKGLRLPVLLTAAFVWAGCAARMLHIGTSYRYFFHLGQLLNGMAAPVTFFACTAVSSVWFPPRERVLATGLLMLTGNFGTGISYVIGPFFVKWFSPIRGEESSMRHGIIALLAMEYLIASLLVVLIIFSFRSKPPSPPSFTATLARESFKSAVKIIVTSRDAWVILLVYSVPTGMWGGWLAILSWVIRERISEVEAGWIGLAAQLAGATTGLLISAIASKFHKRIKLFTLITVLFCCVLVSWHVLTYHYLTEFYSRKALWLCIIGTTASVMSSQPLLWEACCELCYPAPESVVSAALSLGNSFVMAVLLVVATIPSLGTAWMDWALVATFWACLPLLIWLNPVQHRSALDN